MRFFALALCFAIFLSVPAAAQHAPNATMEPTELAEFSSQPSRIKELIVFALALTKLDLDYTFGSDDPARGGMDCSGTIYHLLHTQGLKDVPRDSPGQYEWTHAAGGYHDVASKSADSEEFADLRPGDLMFWSGTYETQRTGVAVSHVMLYLGTEKKTGKRVVFGASNGRSYNGVQRYGVSVFDFKMPRPEETKADFLGYGRIPGLPGGAIAATTAPIKTAAKDDEEAAPKAKSGEKSESAKTKTVEAESETPKPRSKTQKSKSRTQTAKAETEEAESEGPKPKPQTRKPVAEAEKSETAKTKSTEPESETPKPGSKTQKSQSGTQVAKAETEGTETVVAKPKSQTRKSIADTPKPKAEADEAQAETRKSKTTQSTSGVSKAKTGTARNAPDASEPEPKTQNPKAGFQKPKEKTEESSSDAEKPKPQTPKPKPKPRTNSKKSKPVSERLRDALTF